MVCLSVNDAFAMNEWGRAQEAGLRFEEISLGNGITSRSLYAAAGAGTAPQLFCGGQKIGGAEDLEAWRAKRGQ